MLLFSSGPNKEGEEEQAGGRNMLPVRQRSERGGYEDGHQVLPRAFLLEILEGYHVYILRSYSEILSMSLY